MTVTLADLILRVEDELEDHAMRGSAEVIGDGETDAFLIAPLATTIVDDAVWAVFIDGVATAAYTMDYGSGVCTMVVVPTTAQTVSWNFNYKRWPEALVTQAINAGITNLFPSLYLHSNEIITAAAEVACPATAEYITGVDKGSVGKWKRLQAKRYDVFYTAGAPYIHFSTTPSGSVRVHYVARGLPLSGTTDDLVADSGLPERAADAIVSFACYYLLSQKMAPRVRSDVGVVTQGQGVLMPSQMNYGAQGYMMRFQFQLASVKMNPWGSR